MLKSHIIHDENDSLSTLSQGPVTNTHIFQATTAVTTASNLYYNGISSSNNSSNSHNN